MQKIGSAKVITEFQWGIDFESFSGKGVLVSPEFSFSDTSALQSDAKTTWKLVLFTNGDKSGKKKYVSLYLVNLSFFGITASINFSHCYNNKNSKTCELQDHYFPSVKSDDEVGSEPAGFLRYCKQIFFKKCVKSEDFFIKCTIEIKSIDIAASKNLADAPLALAETAEARNAEVEPCDYVERLLNNGAFSDVTIKAQGKRFYLHKCILSTRSSVFEAMFKDDILVNKHRIVVIKNYRSKVLQELFRYVYVSKVCELELDEIVGELLSCAEVYDVIGLKKLCEDKMSSSLNNLNAINYYNIAVQSKAKDLETQAIDYIGVHLDHFINTDEYIRLSLEHPQVSIEITKKYVNSKNQL